MSLLDISVEPGESGPVLRLSGEVDLNDAGQLSDALNAQVSAGARHLTVDLSGLRFIDSAAVGTLIRAHQALNRQGGSLELAKPQPAVARILGLLGVDQVIPVRPQAGTGPAETETGSSLLRAVPQHVRVPPRMAGSRQARGLGPFKPRVRRPRTTRWCVARRPMEAK